MEFGFKDINNKIKEKISLNRKKHFDDDKRNSLNYDNKKVLKLVRQLSFPKADYDEDLDESIECRLHENLNKVID